jgi:hypothetical protein
VSVIRTTTLKKIMQGWGKLASHKYGDGPFPARFSQCVAFITPKLKQMGFDVDTTQELMKSFLEGATNEYMKEIEQDK